MLTLKGHFTSAIHYHSEALELVLIITPMDLLKDDLLTSWYYIINPKIIEKSQNIRQCQIDLLFSATWKKIQCLMRWNHFIFVKKVNAWKGIFFLFYQIVRETLFYEKVYMKNLYESQFRRFHNENNVYLAFKFALNKNQSGWLTTSHGAQLYF